MTFTVTIRVADRGVDLRLDVADGETVAVLGPNGAGKSTLVTAIAGLLRPDSGSARLGDHVLFDLPAGSWTPPHRRGVALLAQDALLFPHLTALENVAFGPRSSGVRPKAAREIAARWLEEVDATALADRKPAELSGGQAQRIAVARALAAEPGLLLLDEPMAALDVSVAPALRRMLRRVLVGRSAIIVTHDVLDAYTLADRVVIVENGRIADEGTPSEVFDRPRSPFVAELTGVNLLAGVIDGRSVLVRGARAPLPADGLPGGLAGTEVLLAVRPADVAVGLAEPRDRSLVAVEAPLVDVEPRGDLVRVRSATLAADVTPKAAAALDRSAGSPLWFSFPVGAAAVYPAAGGDPAGVGGT